MFIIISFKRRQELFAYLRMFSSVVKFLFHSHFSFWVAIQWTFCRRRTYASPAPKANDDLAKATFYTDCAKVKNGLALGVRVHAIVMQIFYAHA